VKRALSHHERRVKLGANIREARRRLGYTQENLAGAMDLSVAYVSLIERGGRNPPFTTVCDLAVALHTTISGLTQGVA
jgi:transcriptional regulator with XRE-family HTH domain